MTYARRQLREIAWGVGPKLDLAPRTADFVSASQCPSMSAEDSIRARIGGIEWSIAGSLIVGDGNLSGDWHSNLGSRAAHDRSVCRTIVE